MPKKRSGILPHQPKQPENRTEEFVRAVRYQGAEEAARVYWRVREEVVFGKPGLFLYRLLLDHEWYVVVLGTKPSEEVVQRLDNIMENGEPETFPEEIVLHLMLKRLEVGVDFGICLLDFSQQ